MNTIQTILKENKLKLTPQRLAIYYMLYNTNTHPTAETIYKSLSITHPSMSLATVYKTLDSLKKAGLVKELNVGEDSFRYDANCEEHMHFVCNKCKKVFDIPDVFAREGIFDKVKEDTGFSVDEGQFYFFGTCKDCIK